MARRFIHRAVRRTLRSRLGKKLLRKLGIKEILYTAANKPNPATQKLSPRFTEFRDLNALYPAFLPSLRRRLLDFEQYVEQVRNHRNGQKSVIYSAIIGGKSFPVLPEKVLSQFDYVLFTDRQDLLSLESSLWQIRPVPSDIKFEGRLLARYLKTHPHQLFEGHEFAIWVDANIAMLGDFEKLANRALNTQDTVAALRHPSQSSLEEEARAILALKKDHPELVSQQVEHYQGLGFKTKELAETSIVSYPLKNPKVRRFTEIWFGEIESRSIRDQLSFNFALQQVGLNYVELFEPFENRQNTNTSVTLRHAATAFHHAKLFHQLVERKLGAQTAAAKASPTTVEVVLPVYNSVRDVQAVLESLARTRNSENLFNLIIVDDASSDGAAELCRQFAKQHDWVDLLLHKENQGYLVTVNEGLSASTAELVVLLNSDAIVTEHWISKFVATANSTENAALISALSNNAGSQSIYNRRMRGEANKKNLSVGATPEKLNALAEQWSAGLPAVEVPSVHGFCIAITRKAIEAVGLFDQQNFPLGNGEEVDYAIRAEQAGFKNLVLTDTFIYHRGSGSFDLKDKDELIAAGKTQLIAKHSEATYRALVQRLNGIEEFDLIAWAADIVALEPLS